jgi:hypothetical protein
MQKSSAIKFISWAFIIYQFIVMLLSLNGSIAFGDGLGDLGTLLVYFIILIILSVFISIVGKIKNIKRQKIMRYFILGLCFISASTMTLYFTIWRGPELPWNGKVFSP